MDSGRYRSCAAAIAVAIALVAAPLTHALHGHGDAHHASQLHATCVVCHFGSPVAAQPAPAHVAADDAPICHLSLADRDRAIPPARVPIDLSRAPPAILAS